MLSPGVFFPSKKNTSGAVMRPLSRETCYLLLLLSALTRILTLSFPSCKVGLLIGPRGNTLKNMEASRLLISSCW